MLALAAMGQTNTCWTIASTASRTALRRMLWTVSKTQAQMSGSGGTSSTLQRTMEAALNPALHTTLYLLAAEPRHDLLLVLAGGDAVDAAVRLAFVVNVLNIAGLHARLLSSPLDPTFLRAGLPPCCGNSCTDRRFVAPEGCNRGYRRLIRDECSALRMRETTSTRALADAAAGADVTGVGSCTSVTGAGSFQGAPGERVKSACGAFHGGCSGWSALCTRA